MKPFALMAVAILLAVAMFVVNHEHGKKQVVFVPLNVPVQAQPSMNMTIKRTYPVPPLQSNVKSDSNLTGIRL